VDSFSSCLKVIALKHRLAVMAAMFQEIKQSLHRLYGEDAHPWMMRLSSRSTGTVVERDKASEGLLAAGDERMEDMIAFRDPANGLKPSGTSESDDAWYFVQAI